MPRLTTVRNIMNLRSYEIDCMIRSLEKENAELREKVARVEDARPWPVERPSPGRLILKEGRNT